MLQRFTIASLIVLMLASRAFSQHDRPLFKSPSAREALRDYDTSVERLEGFFNAAQRNLRKKYDAEVDKLRKQLLEKLEEAKKEATTEANLDEALKIRNFVESLDAKSAPASPHRQIQELQAEVDRLQKALAKYEPISKPNLPAEDARFALHFDGRSYVHIPSLKYAGGPLTLEAYVYLNSHAGQQTIVGNAELSGAWLLINTESWKFYWRDSSGYKAGVSDAAPALHKWMHVAGVTDGRSVRLYLDGQLQRTYAVSDGKHKPSTFSFYVGADPGVEMPIGSFFNGIIDEVRVSGVARYSSNFKPPVELESDKFTACLLKFDEGIGNKAKDSTANGHNGEIKSATWIKIGRTTEYPYRVIVK